MNEQIEKVAEIIYTTRFDSYVEAEGIAKLILSALEPPKLTRISDEEIEKATQKGLLEYTRLMQREPLYGETEQGRRRWSCKSVAQEQLAHNNKQQEEWYGSKQDTKNT